MNTNLYQFHRWSWRRVKAYLLRVHICRKLPRPSDSGYKSQETNVMVSQTSRRSNNALSIQSQYIVRSEINQRENNEDSFQILFLTSALGQNPITVLAVADGMGGHVYGELVSQEALKKFSLSLSEQLVVERSINKLEKAPPIDSKSLSKAMMDALEQANDHVKRMVEINKWGKAGSTIVVAAILEDKVVVVNLGDSPLFHYQASTGQLTKITEDHTVAGVLLRAGMITPEMARYHEGRSRLEFYVGCPKLPSEDPVYQVSLAPGDLLLLSSDGVSGSLLDEQIAEILRNSNYDLNNMAEYLFKASRNMGETDNQTLILWRYQSGEVVAAKNQQQEEQDLKKTNIQFQTTLQQEKTEQQPEVGGTENQQQEKQDLKKTNIQFQTTLQQEKTEQQPEVGGTEN